jgi:hypothetical protein
VRKVHGGSVYYAERYMSVSIFHEIFLAVLAYVREAAPA